jgi:hypothetical protein
VNASNASVRTLRSAATRVGATVRVDRRADWIDISVDAPSGHVWRSAGGCHVLIDSGHAGPSATAIIAARLLPDVNDGVEPCDAVDCDVCHDEARS